MFQTFDAPSPPEAGPARLAALRTEMANAGVSAFLVPRADAHQGEYVAPCDERLSWLTGFTGSAGFAAITPTDAGVFIDGRYHVQVKTQIALSDFTPDHWPETNLADWLAERTKANDKIGFDPWLHTVDEIAKLTKVLDADVVPLGNLVDRIWQDRPDQPNGKISAYPIELSGQSSVEKREAIAATLHAANQTAVVLTLPDSIAWLLNIRGNDIQRIPVPRAFAILHADATVELFVDPQKVASLGPDPSITVHAPEHFADRLAALTGLVRIDPKSAPAAIAAALQCTLAHGTDPCVLPKACKNKTELKNARVAHQRDAVAVAEFLFWMSEQTPGSVTEIQAAIALEGCRRATYELMDISFDTISGSGPNGAIVHYRVTHDTDRVAQDGELFLIDSGGQYLDGTTDITRTLAVGQPDAEQRTCFTLVLRGMIAISCARWPRGLMGRDLDPLARSPLWSRGMDYDHGTGHGVGQYLSVHEGPQRISRLSEVALVPGMILSIEPGYYREGAFGIRIENLIVVQDAAALAGADDRSMLDFETLTYVPIDRNLIDPSLMSSEELAWLNAYHAETLRRLSPHVSVECARWLKGACAQL